MAEGPPRFASDGTLMRLARWLRLMGADVWCPASLSASAILESARAENRIMLTRDKRIRTAPDVLYIEGHLFRDQLREVMARYPFDARAHAFTRCAACNELLREVPREMVGRRAPAFVYATHERFSICERCNHIYWSATHRERALREIEALGF